MKLSVGPQKERRFEAHLKSADISVSGVFFESTFLLKVGQRVDVELTLPPRRRVVASGPVVRAQALGGHGEIRSGFAVRFDDYRDDSEVALANYFLAPQLRAFLERYAKRQKVKPSSFFLEQAVEVLAAWELEKAEADQATVWREI